MLKISTLIAVCLLASHCDAQCEDVQQFALCQDFRDIRNLIPANTLVYFISAGYRDDESFRKAMDYIKTDQFQLASQQIADSNGYKKLLQRFSDAGLNVDSIASISNIFSCLMISMPKYGDEDETYDLEMQSLVVPRSLQDVATNLMASIPRHDFRALIRQKLRDNGDFAKFYHVVRSKSFKREVRKLFASYQMRHPLNVLKRHNIDLAKLAKMANEILEWGPNY